MGDHVSAMVGFIFQFLTAFLAGAVFWSMFTDSDLDRYKAQAKIGEKTLEFLSWPGPEIDHWERVNTAKEGLEHIRSLGRG